MIYGGALYCSNFAKVRIDDKSEFDSNRALDLGDDIYAADTKNPITLDSISINNPNAKSSIFADSVTLLMYRTTIKNIQSGGSLTGGAL